MHRFVYCCPAAAATDDFDRRMAGNTRCPPQVTVTPPQARNTPAHPPSYESLRSAAEQDCPEAVPFSVELAIRDWIGANQPSFSLDIGKSKATSF